MDNASNITINIIEPSSDVPVPDTGLFTHGIGGIEASIIVTIAIVIILAIFTTLHLRKKKISLKPSKHTSIILSILAIITSIATFTGLTLNSIYNHTNAKEGDLTVTTEDANLTIELADEPVFAVLPVDVKVQESTGAGYTLTSYADNTNLISTTDSSKVIPMVAVDEGELVALADNTYGLALEEKPTTKDEAVYTALSTDSSNPTILKAIDDYSSTPANDTTTIYYGFYITPDTPYGTYKSSDIYYNATTNSSKVIFHGNGLYFNNNPEQTTNDVDYITGITEKTVKYSHTPNVNDEGEASGIVGYHGSDILNKVITIPGASKISIKLSYGGGYISGGYPAGFVSFWQGTHPDYTTENNIGTTVKTCGTSGVTDGKFYGDRNNENTIITTECELEGNAVTFAYWTSGGGPSSGAIYGYYATVTGYDADGNIIYLPGNTQVGGEYKDPSQDLPYIFLGWNEDKDATAGIYESKNDIEINLPLTKGKTTELYAIWQHATKIHLDGNGSTSGEIPDKLLAPGKGTSLCGYYYTRDGYIFNNWNTKPDGSGESYGQCYWYTAPADQSIELNLYAQWSPATTITYDGNGGEGNQQQQTIRAGETSNIYGNWGYFNKDGYAFSHWNTKPDGSGETYYEGNQFTASDQSTTITLYAQWAPATTITFNSNGGEGSKSNQTIRAGNTEGIYGNWGEFYRDGYAWTSWNTKPDGSGDTYYEGQEFTAPEQSQVITLYAQWSPATTITYDGNGYDWGGMGKQTIYPGNTEELWNNDYHKNGYYFTGWNTESDGSGISYNNYQSITASDQSTVITLYAQWMPEGEGYYTTITFNGNGADGGEMENQIVAAGQTIETSCNNYWKDSHWFFSWNTEPDGTGTRYDNCGRYTAPAGETTNITLYAIWAEDGANTTIVYDGNGADGGYMDNQIIWAGNTEQIWGANYWKNYYNFIGWNTEPDGNGTSYNAYEWYTASYQTETITLYAQWEEQAHTTFIYDGNGADSGEMSDQTIYAWQGDNIWCGSDYYRKDGYYFVNWNTDPEGNGMSYDCWQWYEASDQTTVITLYAQWIDCTANYICYKSNGADGSTSMQNQYAYSSTEVTLWASNFSYSGHGFAGWSKDQNAAAKLTDDNPDNNPTIYGPNQTIFTENMDNGMSLYAVWLEPAKDINNNPLTFQTENLLTTTLSDNTTLASKPNGYITALKDSRDNQVYAVAKLADGNYWMIENLRLDNTAEITLENTNNPNQTYISGPGSDMVVGIRNNDGSYYNHLSLNSDNWCTDSNTGCYNQSYLNTKNTAETASEMSDPYNYNIYSYGNYYNWYSAMAGRNSQDGDICPAGWQLPYGGSSTDEAGGNTKGGFYYFNNILNNGDTDSTASNNWRSFPNNFIYSGYWYGSSVNDIGNYGYYWSSTGYNYYSYSVYFMGFNSYYIEDFNWTRDRNSGSAVRCIAQITTTIIYDGNGAESGDVPSRTVKAGRSTWLQSGSYYTKAGYEFAGWNTEPDGSGTAYAASSEFIGPDEPGTITLYAQWEEPTTIIFNGNGNTGGEGLGDRYLSAGGTTQLCGSYWRYGTYYYYTKTNHQFIGWNTEPDGSGTSYADCAEFTAPAEPVTITLYAQWEEQTHTTFIFDGNGADSGEIPNQTIYAWKGDSIWCGSDYYQKDGYYFVNWNTDPYGNGITYECGQWYVASGQSEAITLYAQWTDKAILDTGMTVNTKLKHLAGNSSASYSTEDTNVTTITRASNLPADFTPTDDNIISINDFVNPVYAWYDTDTTTIYYYTESEKIIMNPDSSYMFYYFRSLSDATSIADWDTSNVTDMNSMFYYAGYNATTFSLDLSAWDTSNVTNMSYMFYAAGKNATTWSIGDLSSWDTLNVTNMSNMFANAGYNATTFSLDLSAWDTSNVTDMSYMFNAAGYNATTWSIGDLSSWDTLNVTNMSNMFANAGYNATTWSIGDLSSWDTSNVTNMSNMFYYAGYNATTFSLDLSAWDTSNVTNMSYMFNAAGYNATTWSIGDLSSWDTLNVTNMSNMFANAGYNATTFSLDLSSWDTSKVKNMGYMFFGVGNNATTFSLDLSSWDTLNVTYMNNMFASAGSNATTWSVTIPPKTGDINNTTSAFYGHDSSVYTVPASGKSFTLAAQVNSNTTNNTGSLNSINNVEVPIQNDSSENRSVYTTEDAENTEDVDNTSSDITSTPSRQEPLGEYQNSTTTSTEDTNIIIPILIVTSTALGTSALALLVYKSRRREDE